MYFSITLLRSSLLLAYFFSAKVHAQIYDQNDRKKIAAFISTVDTYHLQAEELLPSVPERIGHLFILELESSFRIFTREDLHQLENNFSGFPEYPSQAALKFLEKSYTIYEKRLDQRAEFLQKMRHIHWHQTDTIHLYSRYNFQYYPENEEELLQGWYKNLKYETLLAREQHDTTASQLNVVLQNLVEVEQCKLQQYLHPSKGLKEELLIKFMKAYARSFDPHSDFFDEESMEIYNSSLSSDSYTTGIYASFESEKLIINYIEPSSPAWDLQDLEEGDEIIYVKCGPIAGHPACLTPDEVESCFFSPDHKELQLSVKSRKTGQTTDLTLRKEISKNLYNEIYAATLTTGESTIGYISFPTFYLQQSDFDSSVSQDLARIILEMKSRKIAGLIIDLRNNGGGSVEEAIDLSGFFIDNGPLFWSQTSFSKNPTLNKDFSRGSLYDGKIMVVTNYATASASEMFLCAMKQYGRVLHVGSKTFGKATGQMMVPIAVIDNPIPFGYLKITTLTVHTLDGHSYQQEGIKPDIELPEIGFGFLYREDHQPYALPNTSIDENASPKKGEKLTLSDQLLASHQLRMQENAAMQHIVAFQDSIYHLSEDKMALALNLHVDFNARVDFERMENHTNYQISSLDDTELNQRMSKELVKDPILYEALLLFRDWVNED